MAAVGLAVLGEERGFGLFNNFNVPFGVAVLLSVLAIDLVIYLQHVAFHAMATLWRLHRVYHFHLAPETNSNFGFNLSWWDRLLATYRAQPAEGHEQTIIGLDQFPEPRRNMLPWMLALPFTEPPAQDSLNPST
jgi:sterol desaturase/sphingolipid hydroxylase (fatty acid hydroxylase superfamily)